MEQGFIKLHRSILKWEWWQDSNTTIVFLWLLLNAQWEDSRFRGYEIPKGSLVMSWKSLSRNCGISVQSARTAINHLKLTGEITIKSTNKFSIVTIANWEKYQGYDEDANKQINNQINKPLTNDQQTTNNIKEYKNIRNKENKNNIGDKKFIPPSVEDVQEYCKERNNNVDAETFISFYESKGWMVGKNKMKDWKACVRTWERSRDNKRLTDTQLYAMEHGHQSSSNPNFLDKLERETRNQYHNYIHGNYDFEQMEKELRAK